MTTRTYTVAGVRGLMMAVAGASQIPRDQAEAIVAKLLEQAADPDTILHRALEQTDPAPRRSTWNTPGEEVTTTAHEQTVIDSALNYWAAKLLAESACRQLAHDVIARFGGAVGVIFPDLGVRIVVQQVKL